MGKHWKHPYFHDHTNQNGNTCRTYLDLWSLPNCTGSTDGKYISIKCFPKTRSLYFNYKGYFSVILLACEDTDALFTTVHFGDFGKNSDGSMFWASVPSERSWRRNTAYPVSNFPTTG
jgi:hypothetical protein